MSLQVETVVSSHFLNTHPAKVPFIIGLCGNMDLNGYDDDYDKCLQNEDIKKLKLKIFSILDWVRGRDALPGCGVLDPVSGRWCPEKQHSEHIFVLNQKTYFGSWNGLNLRQTPIVFLTSLAPGADTLVAESILEYVEMYQDFDIMIRCPLPFPIDHYKSSTTFDTSVKKARLDSLLLKIRSQRGFNKECEEHDIFEVQLDNDLVGDSFEDLTREDTPGKPRRRLRYRAAGEYIAGMSQLLLAVHDVEYSFSLGQDVSELTTNLFECGTNSIIEAKRSGLSHELLAIGNNFSWADNGPVLVLPVHRKKNRLASAPGNLYFLHPYDCKPKEGDFLKTNSIKNPDREVKGCSESEESLWLQSGDQCFRRILSRLEKFNRLSQIDPEKERLELAKLLGDQQEPWMDRLVKPLESLAKVRRKSADNSIKLNNLRKQLLKRMWVLIFITAFSLGAFEHWHNSNEGPSTVLNDKSAIKTDPRGLDMNAEHHLHNKIYSLENLVVFEPPAMIQNFWLISSLVGFLTSSWLYYSFIKDGNEESRYDYRSISEALRVQFYWIITGTGRNVSAEYMQRQRDELDWIRALVISVSIPLESSRRFFMSLSKEKKAKLFSIAHTAWVFNQARYFRQSSIKMQKEARTYHHRSLSLLAGGMISIIGLLISHLSPVVHFVLDQNWLSLGLVLVLIGITLLFISFFFNKNSMSHNHPVPADENFLSWVFREYGVWGSGIFVAGIILLISFFIGCVGKFLPDHHQACLPDSHNAWLIFTGSALLAGGLYLAWVERNFLNEEARAYSSIAFLYDCADRRIRKLIECFKHESDTNQEERILGEIQYLFYQLGRESLNENAEWLIQHRARPLEMFVAG